MKFIAQAGGLATAAKLAAGVVSRKAAKHIPIVRAVLIDAGLDGVRCTGTDLDRWLSAVCPGSVDEAGLVAVPAAHFANFVAKVPPDAEVAIETSASGLHIRSGRAHCDLQTLAPGEFPPPPTFTASAELVLGRDHVDCLFGAAATFICKDGVRHYLAGAFLHRSGDGRLCAVATDGHQLLLATCAIVPTPEMLPERGIIVPEKTIDAIVGLAGDRVSFRSDKNVIEARAANIVVVSKLITGTFPDFTCDIPAGTAATAELERGALFTALAPLNVAAAGKRTTLMLGWDGDGIVTLELAGVVQGYSEIPAITAGTATIKLAVDRFTKLIEAVAAERVALGFTAPTQPLRIQAGEQLAVLAPLLF